MTRPDSVEDVEEVCPPHPLQTQLFIKALLRSFRLLPGCEVKPAESAAAFCLLFHHKTPCWGRKRIQRKCLYLHKCGGCLLGLCVWLSKCKRDSPALHAAQKRQQPMGGGGEAGNPQRLDFSTCGPNARADALFVFKQSNFSFMITLHHPRLQLHLSALRVSAVCADFL